MTEFCACGCGRIPPVARRTDRQRGYVRGRRCRCVPGHKARHVVVQDRGYLTPCHIADGAREDGYARVTVDGKRVVAHRAAYERDVGPIPEGLEPDHLCRQRDCVRTDHLELVTHAENCRRGATTKLALADVIEIRSLLAHGELSQAMIGERFGVTQMAVSKIKTGRTWAEAA